MLLEFIYKHSKKVFKYSILYCTVYCIIFKAISVQCAIGEAGTCHQSGYSELTHSMMWDIQSHPRDTFETVEQSVDGCTVCRGSPGRTNCQKLATIEAKKKEKRKTEKNRWKIETTIVDSY